MPSSSVLAEGKEFRTEALTGSSQKELTWLHLHCGPVCVTLTLCISHFQVKGVGSLDQVGKKEDGVMVRVV